MLNRRQVFKFLPAAALLPRTIAAHAAAPRIRLLIGTGTESPSASKGIYVADWNLKTGELGAPTLLAALESPTWLALSPRAPRLYALSEIKAGKVTAFDLHLDTSVTLQKLNEQSSEGEGPAHVSVNVDGRSAFVANYGSGSITSYKIEKSGALSTPVTHIQYTPVDADPAHAKPHAHEATPSPDGRFLLVNDLGSDRILVYKIDAGSGKLTPNSTPFWQGRFKSGPRHLTFHPNGKWVYNVNELDSTVDLLLLEQHPRHPHHARRPHLHAARRLPRRHRLLLGDPHVTRRPLRLRRQSPQRDDREARRQSRLRRAHPLATRPARRQDRPPCHPRSLRPLPPSRPSGLEQHRRPRAQPKHRRALGSHPHLSHRQPAVPRLHHLKLIAHATMGARSFADARSSPQRNFALRLPCLHLERHLDIVAQHVIA